MKSFDTPAARLATRLAFLVAGFGVACWAPLVPYAKQRLQVDDGTLGLLLLCLGTGSVLAMVRTGPLCARHGCKSVILAGGVGLVLLLPALAVASNVALLGVALLIFGASLGSLDVAMNVHAVEVERDAGRPLMSGFHALFSVGGFAGAAAMTFLLSSGVSPLAGTVACSVAMAAALLVAAPRLLHTAQAQAPSGGAMLAVPRGAVVLLALLAAVTFLVEGALLDWSALLMTESRLAAPAQAGIGFAVFSVAMTIGRFGGDAVVARLGNLTVLRAGGVIAVAGFALLLLSTHIAPALLGFALIGLGASNLVPILFSKAGAQSDMSAAMAISAVTTTGYAGYLMGPAAVGFVSKAAGLPAAFWSLAALMVLVPLCAGRVARSEDRN